MAYAPLLRRQAPVCPGWIEIHAFLVTHLLDVLLTDASVGV